MSSDSETSIELTLKEIIGRSSRERMDALCQCFIASGNYQEISNTLSLVEALNKRIRNVAFHRWSESGTDVPKTLISQAIHTVVKALEDLLLNAMEGNDLSQLVQNGLLLYQVVPDVTLQ